VQFFDYKDGCRPPTWIFKNLIFLNSVHGLDDQYAKNQSNRCWNIAIYFSFKVAPSAILHLWSKLWDDQQRVGRLCGLYQCAKVG